jgi:urease accessory protein
MPMTQPMNSPSTSTGWQAKLALNYSLSQGRSVAHHAHEGPLRVLMPLYPEGDAVCHHVLVHPPGGLVGGDRIDIDVHLDSGSHALITTPGATRFYRSEAGLARQQVQARLQSGARLEWLPLETLTYNDCQAENLVTFDLEPGAELMAWDVLALGLPHAQQPFVAGRYLQHLQVAGAWLDRGMIDAQDQRLLNGPLGLAGQRCLASLVLAAGQPIEESRAQTALDQARELIQTREATGLSAGATRPHPRVLVVRVLCAQVEPAMALLQAIWAAWRQSQWDMTPCPSRMWRV